MLIRLNLQKDIYNIYIYIYRLYSISHEGKLWGFLFRARDFVTSLIAHAIHMCISDDNFTQNYFLMKHYINCLFVCEVSLGIGSSWPNKCPRVTCLLMITQGWRTLLITRKRGIELVFYKILAEYEQIKDHACTAPFARSPNIMNWRFFQE